MKDNFPKYEKKSLKPAFKNFKSGDKKLIEDYLVLCGGTAGKTTLIKYRSVLTKICDVFEGDLDKIDLKKLRKFLNLVNQSELLPSTKNEIKKVLKRFLKETYEDWFTRFKELKDIKGGREINQNKINGDTILRKEEIEALIRGAKTNQYKAMIILFYETAGRPEEILKLKWGDINLERGEVRLNSSKTKNIRINPIQNSIIHLKRYKRDFPYVNLTKDDFIFVSPQNRNKHLSGVSAGANIKRLGKRILKRDIFLYLIRHTRATELQKELPAKVYEKFMDHSIETATRYSHLEKEDVRDAMFKNVYKTEELPPEKKHELEKEIETLKELLKESETIQENKMKDLKEEMKELNSISKILIQELKKGKTK